MRNGYLVVGDFNYSVDYEAGQVLLLKEGEDEFDRELVSEVVSHILSGLPTTFTNVGTGIELHVPTQERNTQITLLTLLLENARSQTKEPYTDPNYIAIEYVLHKISPSHEEQHLHDYICNVERFADFNMSQEVIQEAIQIILNK